MRRSTATLTLGLLALAAARPASAQIDFSREIDQLQEAAVGLAASSAHFQGDLKDAIRVHARAVELRSADDPQRAQAMLDHASLLAAAGKVEDARTFVARAVAQSMRMGDVLGAADASATAALLAQRAGDFDAAKIFRKNARSLALSPELTAEQSTAIAARLYGAGWVAASKGGTAMIE